MRSEERYDCGAWGIGMLPFAGWPARAHGLLGRSVKLIAITMSLLAGLASAQVQEVWTRSYPANSFRTYGPAMALDADGNVIVGGQVQAAGNVPRRDFLTIKYSPDGDLLWTRNYPGATNNSIADTSLALDAESHVWVAGESAPPTSEGYDGHATIKYDTDGTPLWVRRVDDPVGYRHEVSSLMLDGPGNAIVTGGSRQVGVGFDFDWLTVKYSPAGDELWRHRYAGPGSDDYLRSSALDGDGNVLLFGDYGEAPFGFRVGSEIIKLTSAGDLAWEQHFTWDGTPGYALAMAVDAAGKIHVAGVPSAFGKLLLRCYSPAGALLWNSSYDGMGFNISAATMRLDGSGNIYLTGFATRNWTDGLTLKFDLSGRLLWAARYNGFSNPSDSMSRLQLDDAGNVYVSGTTEQNGGSGMITVKYAADGNQRWAIFRPGISGAASLAVHPSGTIYSAGIAGDPDGPGQLTTVKYVQTDVPNLPSAFVTAPGTRSYVGFNVVLGAAVTGPGPFAYQWRFFGQAIRDATNATLSLTNIQLAQQGDYSVVASNTVGFTISPEKRLSLFLPARITAQPPDQDAVAGQEVVFNASTEGSPPLFHQWFFNEMPINGAQSNRLTLLNVQPTNLGSYYLVVTNGGASITSRVARLLMLPAPVATNADGIDIDDDSLGAPYPSVLTVSGVTGWLEKVVVTLYGFHHARASDVDVLLQAPNGQTIVLMSRAGGAANDVTLTFDDAAGMLLPQWPTAILSGAYKPTNHGFPIPEPELAYPTALSAFRGTNPNGEWRLFVSDEEEGSFGNIDGGWSLTLMTLTDPPPGSLIRSIQRAGEEVRLQWDGGAAIRLQRAASLRSTNWTDVPGSLGVNTIQLPITASNEFCRLVSPSQ